MFLKSAIIDHLMQLYFSNLFILNFSKEKLLEKKDQISKKMNLFSAHNFILKIAG